ncbi:protein of unknown function [Cupriavidus taiwanensis]|nr:protein of unknown function [Cupriavidus taiwanensis]
MPGFVGYIGCRKLKRPLKKSRLSRSRPATYDAQRAGLCRSGHANAPSRWRRENHNR